MNLHTDPIISGSIDSSEATPTAGSVYFLTCIVTGAERLTDAMVTYQWLKDGNIISDQRMRNLSFSSLAISDAGSYTCQATVTSNLLSAPITINHSTEIVFTCMKGVSLSYSDMKRITNNSNIFRSDGTVLCLTDLLLCCNSDTAELTGNWYFPNGSIISNLSTDTDVYIKRGPNMVGLYWNDSSSIPTGIFQCEIPDACGIIQKLYVRIEIMLDTTSNSERVAGAVVSTLLVVVLVIAVSVLVVILGRGR